MKITEIAWKDGSEYSDKHNITWVVIGGELWKKHNSKLEKEITSVYNLCEIATMEFTKITDWSKVAVDTKIFVKMCRNSNWERRHFAEFRDERVCTFAEGSTSWTGGDKYQMAWNYAKLVFLLDNEDINEFIDLVGEDYFCEGDIKVTLMGYYIGFDLIPFCECLDIEPEILLKKER